MTTGDTNPDFLSERIKFQINSLQNIFPNIGILHGELQTENINSLEELKEKK